MKIIIDCSLISKNMRGMGIYLKNILSDIDKISKAEFTLLVNNQYGKNFLEDKFNNKNINVVLLNCHSQFLNRYSFQYTVFIKKQRYL